MKHHLEKEIRGAHLGTEEIKKISEKEDLIEESKKAAEKPATKGGKVNAISATNNTKKQPQKAKPQQ